MSDSTTTRRDFVKTAGGAAVGASLLGIDSLAQAFDRGIDVKIADL